MEAALESSMTIVEVLAAGRRHPKHIEIEYSLVAVEASTAGGQWACRRWSVVNNNDLSEGAGASVSRNVRFSPLQRAAS